MKIYGSSIYGADGIPVKPPERDEEYPRLARIFNLAREYRDILVNGIVLPENNYGEKAVSRGDGQTRLITLRNMTWEPVVRNIKLDEEIGLTKGTRVELKLLHPTERSIGQYKWGETVPVEVLPFRSCLLRASSVKKKELSVDGCDYEIVQDVPGKPVLIHLLGFPGERKTIDVRDPGHKFSGASLDGKPVDEILHGKQLEIIFPGSRFTKPYHRKLDDMKAAGVPEFAESLYEATCFAADNNALEVRSLVRSGPTEIPQVREARDAFFNQSSFKDRGLWDRYMFDGDPETSFYVDRRHGMRDLRINGGAFRLDLGKIMQLDSLKIIVSGEQDLQPLKTWQNLQVEVSPDLKGWTEISLLAGRETIIPFGGRTAFRYLRLPVTPENISEIEGYVHGKPVDREGWRASNLFSPYIAAKPEAAFRTGFTLDEIPEGSYLAVALNGRHGDEGAYAAMMVDGKPVGAPDRSPSYRCNAWEYPVVRTDSNYTYYFPLSEKMKGATIDAWVLVMKDGLSEFRPEVWITAYPTPYEKKELVLTKRSEDERLNSLQLRRRNLKPPSNHPQTTLKQSSNNLKPPSNHPQTTLKPPSNNFH